jgi:Heliorhodopsin
VIATDRLIPRRLSSSLRHGPRHCGGAISGSALSMPSGGRRPRLRHRLRAAGDSDFDIFPLNLWLQYRRVGRWKSYVFGERAYFMLSLVAKSTLAWQVFAGTLAR